MGYTDWQQRIIDLENKSGSGGSVSGDYLPLTGGTMTGSINSELAANVYHQLMKKTDIAARDVPTVNTPIQVWRIQEKDGKTIGSIQLFKNTDGSNEFRLSQISYKEDGVTQIWSRLIVGCDANGVSYAYAPETADDAPSNAIVTKGALTKAIANVPAYTQFYSGTREALEADTAALNEILGNISPDGIIICYGDAEGTYAAIYYVNEAADGTKSIGGEVILRQDLSSIQDELNALKQSIAAVKAQSDLIWIKRVEGTKPDDITSIVSDMRIGGFVVFTEGSIVDDQVTLNLAKMSNAVSMFSANLHPDTESVA